MRGTACADKNLCQSIKERKERRRESELAISQAADSIEIPRMLKDGVKPL